MVPFLDLTAGVQEIRDELDHAYHRFMDSGHYVLGEEVAAFETEYAAFCEARHCVGVGSGLDALTLALRSLDVGVGDEVIVPSNTYIATWLAVTAVGATIIPVEPDPLTFNITGAAVEAAISSRTKVVLAVNLYGQPVNYDELMEQTRDRGISLVIDNAQAQGARFRGRSVGGIADIECHSFYPTKNLGAFGEAGAITTNCDKIAATVRLLRNYGSEKRYYNQLQGVNSRLDALQAAFLRVRLKYLAQWNTRRREIASKYNEALSRLPSLTVPTVPKWAEPVWHLYVVKVKDRNDLRIRLTAAGIGTEVHYPIPPHKSGAYSKSSLSHLNLPEAEKLVGTILSLPLWPQMTLPMIENVIDAIEIDIHA
ncbi:MAG TPA: DegT/DnrJ/EryC1/StrS family aminotransferase [Planctomycetaceae bacterium]|nr:DegT/DnrJ/EryC1/StrS family aminotransferase [Planctomycetaceae bacterium]